MQVTRPLGKVSGPFAVATERLVAGFLAIALGALLIYGVGFAGPSIIHNAAHDVRHAFALPCH
jgi:cobalt transporter subunit CbtB